MKIRTECPKKNKYYIRKVTGGLNGAVAGEPTQPYANVLDNCVGYANGRYNEIINDPELKGVVKAFKYQLTCNAENFIESAKRQGLKISPTPIEGGIMVWQKGRTLSGGDGAGHVAVVERVYDDGSIMTSESGWNSWAFKTVRRDNSNGRWGQNSLYKFRGCIINPSIKNPKIVPVPPLDVDGIGGTCTVRAMQRFFDTPQDGVISGQNKSMAKYYPALKSVIFDDTESTCIHALQWMVGVYEDGVLGPDTIKAWQKFLGVKIDGSFGTASMKAWQKYLNENKKAVFPATHVAKPVVAKKPATTTTAPAVSAPKVSDIPKWVENANAWAKKIAADNSWHYVKWSNDKRTHECPVCHKHPKGKYHGWNCIGFAYAVWHHGGGLKNNCNCHIIANDTGDKMYKASLADATKIAKKFVGLNDIKVIRNKKGIPKSEWKPGDICMRFSGTKYTHAFYYMGDGLIADSTGSNGKVANNKQIAIRSYKKYSAKIIIRYTGK